MIAATLLACLRVKSTSISSALRGSKGPFKSVEMVAVQRAGLSPSTHNFTILGSAFLAMSAAMDPNKFGSSN